MGTLPTTAVQRGSSGLDRGARRALLRLLSDREVDHVQLAVAFIHGEAYGDLQDYLEAVRGVHGFEAAENIRAAIRATIQANVDEMRLDHEAAWNEAQQLYWATGMLMTMPEADFLATVEFGSGLLRGFLKSLALPNEVNRILDRRGLPYKMSGAGEGSIQWIGDPAIAEDVVFPALAVLADSRLAGGAAVEFDGARDQLRQNTPESRKRAVAEASSAVESTMKVVLGEHGHAIPSPANLTNLVADLEAEGLVESEGREILVSAGFFGNRKARHGGGYAAHEVSEETAEAVVSAAAVAINYLAKRLPQA